MSLPPQRFTEAELSSSLGFSPPVRKCSEISEVVGSVSSLAESTSGGVVIRMFDEENKSIFYALHVLRNGKVSLKKGFTNGRKVRVKEILSLR